MEEEELDGKQITRTVAQGETAVGWFISTPERVQAPLLLRSLQTVTFQSHFLVPVTRVEEEVSVKQWKGGTQTHTQQGVQAGLLSLSFRAQTQRGLGQRRLRAVMETA